MPWYEKEDLEKAREMTAIEYLKRYEPQRLKPCRGLRHEYELTDHDSFKINEITSQWHWKSRDIGGISALNFLVHVNGMSFLDVVGFLLEQNPSYIPPNIQEREMAKKPFALPERAKDVNRIWNYLKHRGISRETFVYCVNQGILYESLPYHNVVFVGRDEKGQARYAFLRGIYDRGKPFKMEQSGSDKAYSFCVPPSGKCCRVAVYEAAIETLAHMTLEGNRTDKYRLSVGGIYAPKDGRRKKEEKPPLALEHFLENHPEVTQIEICTNNDGPGRYACETMKRTYRDRYEILINLPEREGADNKKSIEEVIETIQDTVNTAFMMIPEIDGTQGIDFRDYDCIKDLLVVELERSEFNGEHLSHGIFEKQPMEALVLYLRLEQKNQLVMVRLGRDVLEVCGVSQSTMMKQAMENTIKINPPVVMPVDTNGRFPYFILSNREGRNGATTITYPGMLEQLRKMAGMDFYVIPANIHEVLIVGKTENAPIRYLREALKQRNREMGIQQMLSDHVYEYSGRDKKLKRCLDEKKKNRER